MLVTQHALDPPVAAVARGTSRSGAGFVTSVVQPRHQPQVVPVEPEQPVGQLLAHDHLGGVARAVRRLRGCARQHPQRAGDVADGCEVDLHPQVIAACGRRCQPARLLTRYVTAGNRDPQVRGPCAGRGLTYTLRCPARGGCHRFALAARAGDRVALSAFVSSTWSEVARLVTAVAGRELAEDATQIGLLPGHQGPALVPGRGQRPHLAAVDRPPGRGRRRAGHRRRRRLTARIGSRAEVTVDVGLDDHTLTGAAAGLETDRRTAFALTQLMGLSYGEAAAVCGCPVGTIRSRVARGLRRPRPPPRHRRPARPPALALAARRARRPRLFFERDAAAWRPHPPDVRRRRRRARRRDLTGVGDAPAWRAVASPLPPAAACCRSSPACPRRGFAAGPGLPCCSRSARGKTTAVPLALLGSGWLGDRRIVMLEPRRLATRAAARRMAALRGEQVGATIGYRTCDDRPSAPTPGRGGDRGHPDPAPAERPASTASAW